MLQSPLSPLNSPKSPCQYDYDSSPKTVSKNFRNLSIALSNKPTEANSLQFISVKKLDDVDTRLLATAIKVYQSAFSRPPYNEKFSNSDVIEAFQYILDKKGDLLFGLKTSQKVVSLAGGYKNEDGTYFIEELAVCPSEQKQGFGKKTFNELLNVSEKQLHSRKEIRTASINTSAIGLYESFGFVKQVGYETVPQFRQNSQIALDERVYLSKPELSQRDRFMKLKRLAVAYPSGNTTAVVFDHLLSIDRKDLNDNIMNKWKKLTNNSKETESKEIEQCCFVTKPTNEKAIAKVEMFGGEFCGNATRSAIWFITKGEDYNGLIEVSGTNQLLEFSVKDENVRVEIPLAKQLIEEHPAGFIVHLDGISHVVVESASTTEKPREKLESLLKDTKFNSLPALGVSYFDVESSKAEFCVWVKSIDTIFDESSCGSGTASIGIYLAHKKQVSLEQAIIQPSKEIMMTHPKYKVNEGVIRSFISGKVETLFDGEFDLT